MTTEPSDHAARVAYAAALERHRRGDAAGAIAGYLDAIAKDDRLASAHCNLGLAYHQLGNLREAEENCRKAIALEPDAPVALNALGIVLRSLGRAAEAAKCCARALQLQPHYAEARANLGAIAGDAGRFREAEMHFREALALMPDVPELRVNLGYALIGQVRHAEAMEQFDAASAAAPSNWEACSMACLARVRCGRLAEAVTLGKRAVSLAPGVPEAHYRLGKALCEADRPLEAIEALRRAVALKPDFVDAIVEEGAAYGLLGDLEARAEASRRAVTVDPANPVAHCSLGIALWELGEIDEALREVGRAINLRPDYDAAHSTRLFLLNYSERYDARTIFDEHQRWAAQRAPVAVPARKAEHADPGRRLRVGYVSPDFRKHSVSFFIGPVLEAHDRRRFEIVCYSDVLKPDTATEALRARADLWRDVAGMADAALADRIRADGIDVLVDLAVHTGSNRLLAFARRPAPVQVTWLGYAGTTGLAAMDYKLTDPILDPPGSEAWHAEALWRLPDCYFCYSPPPDFPEIAPLPARGRPSAVFGAFQNLAKVTAGTLRLWGGVLRAVPDAALVVKARGLRGIRVRERMWQAFEGEGIERSRVELEDWDDMGAYLRRLSEVDVVLDTTPFNGGTTTLHALWMGVPSVTLAGSSALGRMGASILGNLALSEMVAHTPEEFAAICMRLAKDRKGLAKLRTELRARLQRSPLMDAARFTRSLESAYRGMWAEWAARAG